MILPVIELQPGAQVAIVKASVTQTASTQTAASQGVPAEGTEASFSAAFGKSLRESAAFDAGETARAADAKAKVAKAADGEIGLAAETRASLVDAAQVAGDGVGDKFGAGLVKGNTGPGGPAVEGRSNLRFAGGAETDGTVDSLAAAKSFGIKTAGVDNLTKSGREISEAAVLNDKEPGDTGKAVEVGVTDASSGDAALTTGLSPAVSSGLSGPSSAGDLRQAAESEAAAAEESEEKTAIAASDPRALPSIGTQAGAVFGAKQTQVPSVTAKQVVKAGSASQGAKTALKTQGAKSATTALTAANLNVQGDALKSGSLEIATEQSATASQLATIPVVVEATGSASDIGTFARSETGKASVNEAGPAAGPGGSGAAGAVAGRTAQGAEVRGAKTAVREAGTAKTDAKLEGAGSVGLVATANTNAATTQIAVHRATDTVSVAVGLGAADLTLAATSGTNPVPGRAGTAGRSGAQTVSKTLTRTAQQTGVAERSPLTAADVAAAGKAAVERGTATAAERRADEVQGLRDQGTVQQKENLAGAQDTLRKDTSKQGFSQSDFRPELSASASSDSSVTQGSAAVVVATAGVHAGSAAGNVVGSGPVEAANTGSGAVAVSVAGALPVGTAPALLGGESGARGVSSALSGGGLAGSGRTEVAAVAEPHRTLVATPTTLEVGVPNGTEGWLRVRAQVGEQGQVNASLAAGSSAGQEMLHRELPALNAYLHGEQLGVTAVVTERSFAAAGGGVADDPGRASSGAGLANAGTANAGAGQGGTSGGEQSGAGQATVSGRSVAGDATGDALRGYIGAGLSAGVGPMPSDQESGRWLNVRA